MKTTIIELLNKIANGEEPPKKIIFRNEVYEYEEDAKDYYNEEYGWIFDEYDLISILNEPVEILETTITYNQDNYYQYQPYTGEVEIKCNSAKNLWESDKTNKPDKIEKVNTYVLCDSDFHRKCDDGYSLSATEIIDRAFEEYSHKINEIIEVLNENN